MCCNMSKTVDTNWHVRLDEQDSALDRVFSFEEGYDAPSLISFEEGYDAPSLISVEEGYDAPSN